MNQEKYKLFLTDTKHTEESIKSRVARLKKVEEIFQIDADSIIYDETKVYKILDKLKTQFSCITSSTINVHFQI